ncbi:putative quinol monooxygenase [Nigerium massiliense]|uniref:putative quinol monooxygenase n=1 Tax=Nigerium massiliense TaxID=1522317 RepID=UPI00058AC436|nr:putative quinol monooxygenase [Nigerium massiliense]
MLIVHCNVHVTDDGVDAFAKASLANAEASRTEPGVEFFDLIQANDDPTRFVLVEHYREDSDLDFHKTQEHYLKWREDVADLMAEPRVTVKYHPYGA